MDAAVAGTVELNGTALGAGAWSAGNTVYTVPYSGLTNSTLYTVNIKDFEDTANTPMLADNSNTFTTVATVTPPTPATRPTITGPTYMTLKTGYAATSTEAYTISGTSPVAVSKQSGNAAITWNNSAKKLDIAAGLPAGKYEVTLRASNSAGSSTLIFTLTVENPVYWIDVPTFVGGKVTVSPPYISEAGGTVTLTIIPDTGYELESIMVTDMNNASIVIPLSGSGNTRTFAMPAHHIRVVAVFKSTTVGIDDIKDANILKAYTQNGMLYISGVSEGSTLYIYNLLGTLVWQGVATGDVETRHATSLPGRGVYVVTDGKEVVKVSN
jgi:hypothetical protein